MMIRKATSADIPAVAAIYDALLRREEQGLLATGWMRGVYPTEQTAWDALDAGTLYVLEDGAASPPPPRSTITRWRSTHSARGGTTPRRSRCWCCTRWWWIPPSRARATAPLSSGSTRTWGARRGGAACASTPTPQHHGPRAVRPAGLHRGGHRGRYVQRHPRRGAGMSGKNRIAVANTTDKQQDPTYNKGNDTQRRARNGYRTRNDAEF